MTPHWELLRWAGRSIPVAWLLWVVVWVVLALRAKPAVRREGVRSRLAFSLPVALSMLLLLLAKRTHVGMALQASGPPWSWLFLRFIRFYPGVVWVGAPLMLLGTALAFWARFELAGNWSASVALKQDHELVQAGPYRFIRHPIYTGALLAVAGTACAIGQWRGLLALALTFGAVWYRTSLEDRLMAATFGDEYRRYQSRARRLIPFIL
ncbi:MAG TPA: isoprenylcysteine carboxylmethyltransferase family protein [Acetobacteraceae bacterium]|nr:isoprenylcysteine carboxylmethyltransferase family protein [Acetobacteraceae bacterium]